MRMLMKVFRCRRGANAIEFALIASLISIAALAGFQALGSKMNGMYTNVSDKLD